MKKVKIMLLSMALFAVLGGVLAFKAKFLKLYCTTDLPSGLACSEVICPVLTMSTTALATTFKCYTTPVPNVPNNKKCFDLSCISSAQLRPD